MASVSTVYVYCDAVVSVYCHVIRNINVVLAIKEENTSDRCWFSNRKIPLSIIAKYLYFSRLEVSYMYLHFQMAAELTSPVYWVQLPKMPGFPSKKGIKWPVFLQPRRQQPDQDGMVDLLIYCDKIL